ncbi:hypothetical protein [Streptomyces sp. ALI-76-A]|jgi:hypothetical protein|uniref:hypothetical protein n=1 Tax=Streptomyces sp. ALI-76-A TaxID=3025736 RepID=UPI00256F0CA7|nr:hypothetical protein [Streptomyces sp. ALI-76-A]MDL5205976.1 hypothetical protein [Streptomyces sp. ALI-76-A]
MRQLPAPGRDLTNDAKGGPLDGLPRAIEGWRPEDVDDGVVPSAELSRWPLVARPLPR